LKGGARGKVQDEVQSKGGENRENTLWHWRKEPKKKSLGEKD